MNIKQHNFESKINNFIGKKELIEAILTHIEVAKKQKDYLDHCLLYGKPGLGKTTLAKIIAKELSVRIKIIQGPEIQSKIDIINAICNLNDFEILFIDEIHAINKQCYELLYSIMEEHKINIIIGKNGNTKITQVNTPKITIIGATTDIGNLPNPFEERFPIILNFKKYNLEEIITIINQIINFYNLEQYFNQAEIKKIANYSRGTPRTARNLLSRIIDFKLMNVKNLNIIFRKIDLYPKGLKQIEIDYLKLFYDKPLGLAHISQILGINEKTIELKIEPYLFELNLIQKFPNGRKITPKGKIYLQKI